jgi:hypothetical protein
MHGKSPTAAERRVTGLSESPLAKLSFGPKIQNSPLSAAKALRSRKQERKMSKSSLEAIRELTAALTELTEIVTSLDHGFISPARWESIAKRLEKTRVHLTQAAAYES